MGVTGFTFIVILLMPVWQA